MLGLQNKGHRALNGGFDEVCRHRLAVGALDAGQCLLEVVVEACSVVADWRRPG